VLERARAAGVGRIVCVGYDLPTSLQAVALAEQYDCIYAGVGLHPNSVAEAPHGWQNEIERLAQHPRVVAIGESGLDYYRDFTDPTVQRQGLQWHLKLADALGLPVIIHNRDSDADATETLTAWAATRVSKGVPGLLHSFAGSDKMLRACLGAGFAISFSGMVTFTNKSIRHVAEAARDVPGEALLVETDCPYLAPVPHRGQRNEPSYVRAVAERIAELRGVSLEEIAALTTANAARVFSRMEMAGE
jgi:TatD DNase family protein